ncbi:MAG: SDR family oxidoreductase [Microgenomates group bacterium]
MKKVLVIGASGLVGSRFIEMASKDFDVTSVDEKTLDITNEESVSKYFQENKFDAVLNLAAFTDVAGAENQRDDENGLAWKLNVLAPKYLAQETSKNNIFLIHFSTDFVFNDSENDKGPFDEDRPLPENKDNLSWYGWTKLLGEKSVRETSKNSAIVRIAYPFRSSFSGKADWVRKIIELYDAGTLYPLFTDQTLTPIFVDDLVPALSKLIEMTAPGIYHMVSSDVGIYYDMGNYILEKVRGVKDAPQKASLVEFMKTPGRNKRPIFGGLKTEKTQQKLGMKFKTWREMIDEFVSQINKQ